MRALSTTSATVSLAVVAMLLSSTPATAYLLPTAGFADGSNSAAVTFGPTDTQLVGPSLHLLTNSTVVAGSVVIGGEPGYLNTSTTETTSADFDSNTAAQNITVQSGALLLESASDQVRLDPANGFGSASLSQVAIVNATLALTSGAGTFTTANITAPAGGWGVILVSAQVPEGAYLNLSFLNPAGNTILGYQPAGGPVALNESVYPVARLHGTLVANVSGASPRVAWITLGQAAGDTLYGDGVTRSLGAAVFDEAGSATLPLSYTGFAKYAQNPAISPVASTWYSAAIVGFKPFWNGTAWVAYFHGATCISSCAPAIGLATSSDRIHWNYSSSPVLTGTASTWDAAGVGEPFVIRNPFASGWIMYYSASGAIGAALSTDGLNWTKYWNNPILTGTSSTWDALATRAVALVDYNGSVFRMYYNGQRTSSQGRDYGLAFSTDGFNWTKYSSNPVLYRQSGWPDAFDLADGGAARNGDTLYFYYSCGLGSGWRICLATSPYTDGINWTKSGIVIAPQNGWEDNHVLAPFPLFDGDRLLVYYVGLGISNQMHTGIAFGTRVNTTLTGAVDLGGPGGGQLQRLNFNGSVPTGASLTIRLRSSSDNSTWSAWENFTSSGSSIASTPLARYLQWEVELRAQPDAHSPAFEDLQVTFTDVVGVGRYESSTFDFGLDLSGVTVVVNNTGAQGNVAVEISVDDGTTWQRVTEGVFVPFLNLTRHLMYGLELERGPFAGPRIESVALTVQWRGMPENVTVRLGAAAAPMLNVSGVLSSSYNVSLPVDDLNAAIAAALQISPAIAAIDVPFYVTSSQVGTVRIRDPHLTMSLKNPLDATFSPSGLAVGVVENSTTTFSAFHSVFPPDTKVNTTWWLNGTELTGNMDNLQYNFSTNFTSAGTYVLGVEVENGDYAFNHTWSIVVYNVNRQPVFSVLTPSDPVSMSHTSMVNFTAFATDLDGEGLQWTWLLDGAGMPGPANASIASVGPLLVGQHLVTVRVRDPFDTITYSWNVTSTNAAPQVVGQTPAALFSMSHSSSQAFSVVATDADLETISYLWELDGITVSGLTASRNITGLSVGIHTLRVFISDAYVSVSTSWTITSTNAVPRILSRDPSADFNISHSASRVVSVSVLDDDGEALTFQWLLDGSPLSGATGPQATLASLPVGAHTLSLTVRDAYGSNATAWIVFSTNAAPVLASAFPGGPLSASHTASVDFVAAFTDVDGDNLTLRWFVDGAETGGGGASLTLAPVGLGARVVTVQASDGMATAGHTWNVSGTNDAPLVTNHGPQQNLTVSVSDRVTVSVEAADADGDAIGYGWRLGTLPLNATGTSATVGPLSDGPHDLVVTVSDGLASSLFVFHITAVDFAPVILGANPATDFELAHTGSRDVTVSVSDREDDPLTYSWSLGSQVLPATGDTVSVGPLPPGIHTLRLVVRDGTSQTERFWNITVVNDPPVFIEVSPAAGPVTVDARTNISFTARAADPDGDAVTLQWAVDGSPRNVTGPLTLEWLLGGAHKVTVDAVSSGHIVTVQWNVTVHQTNLAPLLTRAAPNGTEVAVTVGEEGVFAVEYEDDGVLPLTITWTVDGTEAGTGAGFVYRPTGSDAGSHDVRVVLSDGEFSTDKSWTVLVSEPAESTSTGGLGDILPLALGLAIGAGAAAAVFVLMRRRPGSKGLE